MLTEERQEVQPNLPAIHERTGRKSWSGMVSLSAEAKASVPVREYVGRIRRTPRVAHTGRECPKPHQGSYPDSSGRLQRQNRLRR
jgi:hypothetical protein